MDRVESKMNGQLVRWVRWVHLHAGSVLTVLAVITLACGVHAVTRLGINSDNVTLVADDLPARQSYLEFARNFPNIENVMLVVVDGETPEIAREATEILRQALAGRPDLFRDVYIPGFGGFFETHGLLYRDLSDLEAVVTQISQFQPILMALEHELTIANLAFLIRSALEQEAETDASLHDFSVLLDLMSDATEEAYQEFPLAISWEEVLLRGSDIKPAKQWTIAVDPVLDFGSIFAAAAPMTEIRRITEARGLVDQQGVRVRLTGNPVINYEEMVGLLWEIGVGGVLTFGFVVLVLTRALRSFRLVMASVITLLAGLVWTASFATAAVGSLNLVSVAFAILFIGLGVDFAIHLGMAYVNGLRDSLATRRNPDPHLAAISHAVDQVGRAFVICTITTAVGFYVFIPTDNAGVAELGLIAGSGMIVNFFLTMTLLPALLASPLRIDLKADFPERMSLRQGGWIALTRWPRVITACAAVLLAWGAWQSMKVEFDANVVRMRDPGTESVETFNEMLEASGTLSPWPMDTVAEDLEAAERIGREVEQLEVVEIALTLLDYVPRDQAEKLVSLRDVGRLLEAPVGNPSQQVAPSTTEQIAALRALRDTLRARGLDQQSSAAAGSMATLRAQLDDFLKRVDHDTEVEAALKNLQAVLLEGLPDQLHRLRKATRVEEVKLDDLPTQLRDRMLTPDGRARVQIFPAEPMSNEAAFTRFAREVQREVPEATGLPMNMVAFAEATHSSFREALFAAISLITLFLFTLWRRFVPVALVLAPLLLSNLVTIGVMSATGIAFNFVNVVVVPLLLGIGVDSGIHLVHRAETLARTGDGDLLSSTTARAVFYSALTTTVSFGTLALSSHQGVASLGVVLSFGMIFTVFSNLVVLPCLLALRGTERSSARSAA